MKLGSVLKRVERGERVRVTRRSGAVADIVPVRSPETAQGGRERSETMKKLIAEGRVTPASRPSSEARPPAPRPLKAGVSGTAIILAEREEER